MNRIYSPSESELELELELVLELEVELLAREAGSNNGLQ